MPSIFVWKSETPNTSNKQIRHYYGSNWFMEDNEYSSKSFKYLEQLTVTNSNNKEVIVYNAKLMPQDWIGSELLEVSCLPYKMIKSDNYGTLEQIGTWMRFTLNNNIEFDIDSLTKEINIIYTWIHTTSTRHENNKSNQNYNNTYVKQNFKYNNNYTNNYNNNYNNNNYNNNYNNKLNTSIENIQLNFQEFLIKYSMPPDVNYY